MKYSVEQKILALAYSQPNLNLSAMAYLLEVHYIWLIRTIKKLEEEGYLVLEKHGRNKVINLTTRGIFFGARICQMREYPEARNVTTTN